MRSGQLNMPKAYKHEVSKIIIEQIEELRSELYCVSLGKSLTDTEVVHVSQQLDNLLNDYTNQILKDQ